MLNVMERRLAVLLDPDVADELEMEAHEGGMETQDFLASILTNHVADRLAKRKPDVAARLAAANRIKVATALISRAEAAEHGIRTDHTLRVFRRLRERHTADYLLATNCQTGFERSVPLKASLNSAIGAISKRAAGASVRKNAAGEPEKIRNIRGEFCQTATALAPPQSVEDERPVV